MRATRWLVAAAGLLLLGAAGGYLLAPSGPQAEAPPTSSPAPAPSVPTPQKASEPVSVGPRAIDTTPKQESSAMPAEGRDTAAPTASGPATDRVNALEQINARLQRMRDANDTDPLKLEQALADLERTSGMKTIGGVDIGRLRDNLVVVAQMQRLTQEMEPLRKKGSALSEAERSQLAAKTRELQTLATRLSVGTATPRQAPSETRSRP